MDIADYWLLEKELVHKLFKVLVPRYETYHSAVTRMHYAPKPQYARVLDKVVLELKQNPYPDLHQKQSNNKYSIQNILLEAAKHDYRQSKINEMANSINTEKQLNRLNNQEKPQNDESKSEIETDSQNKSKGNFKHE